MTDDDDSNQAETVEAGRWPCKEPNCGMPVEASVPLWLDLHRDGSWSVGGIADEVSKITCTEGHDNSTTVLHKSLSAFLEEVAPGTTWVGSDPRMHDDEEEEYDHSRAKEDARNEALVEALVEADTVTVRIENTYSCGRTSRSEEKLPAPVGDPDEKWWDKVWDLTGDGHSCGESDNAAYEATIIAAARLELVGQRREWGG